MQGWLTQIQRFSVHDGPGIRTTVFLKGCNLRCRWCHNPETWRATAEVQCAFERCIGCGACAQVCPAGAHRFEGSAHVLDREACVVCGRCTQACYAGALVLVGRQMTVKAVLAEVREDRAFYADSGGGVTLSGGEPLFQRDFAAAILQGCRNEGIHTAFESNLAWPWEQLLPLLGVAELVMLDLKLAGEERHRELTGLSNARVRENLRRLARLPLPFIARTPVIAGINDTPDEIGAMAAWLAEAPRLLYYELLPYHPLGTGKYAGLGLANPCAGMAAPSAETMARLADVAHRAGIDDVRIAGKKVP